MSERKTVTREEKIALGWTRAEIVDRLARIMRNAMGPEFWEAPPPEWAERAAETIWQNVEAMVRDRLETDRAEIELLRAKAAALPESADEGLRTALRTILALAETLEPDRPLLAPYRQEIEHVARAALAATLPEPGEGS